MNLSPGCEFHEPDEACVHCLGDEIDRLNGLIFAAVNALEVDSEWSADRLLDAITEAITILRLDRPNVRRP